MNVFEKRRQDLMSQIHTGECMVFFAGKPLHKSADSEFEFEVNKNYYYLTGCQEPEGVLLLIKGQYSQRESLFIRPINKDLEKWIGRFQSFDNASEISGIKQVLSNESFETQLSLAFSRMGIHTLYIDQDRQQFNTTPHLYESFVSKVKDQFPAITLKDGFRLVANMRLKKDETEVNAIKQAIELTNTAIESAVRSIKPGKYEYEVMAEYLYVLQKNNAQEMFDTIMASGKNGVILHYVENNSKMKDGDLVLFDLGAKVNQYGADISRTYPVSGKFTDRQKELYNIVLTAMRKVTAAVKPGVTIAQLNQVVIDYYKEALVTANVIEDPSQVGTVYYHGVGHVLGLDTHDVGYLNDMPLEEGFVITNEPGLYIEKENIGIRLETDLLVTKDGCIDLAPQIKIEVEDIEAMLQGD